jgi:hypothetical protein
MECVVTTSLCNNPYVPNMFRHAALRCFGIVALAQVYIEKDEMHDIGGFREWL